VLAALGGGLVLISLALWFNTAKKGTAPVSPEPSSGSLVERSAGSNVEAKAEPLRKPASTATPIATPPASTDDQQSDAGPATTPDAGPATTVVADAGTGDGQLGGSQKVVVPRVRTGATTVSGRLPPEVIQRIVRQNFGRFRTCYEQGLDRNPNLQGRVSARFVIGRDGAVSNVSNGGSDLPDSGVVSCVLSAFYGLEFPQPEGGIVTVVYPIMFAPG
jgi:hypothetical protein